MCLDVIGIEDGALSEKLFDKVLDSVNVSLKQRTGGGQSHTTHTFLSSGLKTSDLSTGLNIQAFTLMDADVVLV